MKISYIIIASAVALGASSTLSAGEGHGYKSQQVKSYVRHAAKVKVFKYYKHRKHQRRDHGKRHGYKSQGHRSQGYKAQGHRSSYNQKGHGY